MITFSEYVKKKELPPRLFTSSSAGSIGLVLLCHLMVNLVLYCRKLSTLGIMGLVIVLTVKAQRGKKYLSAHTFNPQKFYAPNSFLNYI